MKFNAVIDKIMPDVENGSDEPFIIYRDANGGWHCDHARNQYGETYDWVEDVKSADALAITFTGADFSRASFPMVYDKVLTARLRAEYDASFRHSDPGDYRALVNFLEDNMSALTFEVTEYLSQYDRPLAAIDRMLNISLRSDDPNEYYDEKKANEAIEIIENKIGGLINRKEDTIESMGRTEIVQSGGANKANEIQSDETVADQQSTIKIDASEYKPVLTTNLGGWQVTLAENKEKPEPYLVEWRREPDKGIPNDTYFCGVTSDYLEAVSEFTKHLQYCVDVAYSKRSSEKNLHGVDYLELTADHCMTDSRNQDYTGKLIIVKASELKPEYRTAASQLVICSHGNGARPNAKGTSVFGNELFYGEIVCYGRHQIEGIADPQKMPDWAVERMANFESARVMEQRDKVANKKPTLQEKLSEAKHKAASQAAKNSGHGEKPKKRKDMEVK
jgi:hypothetical protein